MNQLPVNNSRILNYLKSGRILLLDGGMSNQLEAQGFDLNNELWSAKVLLSNPRAIVDAHLHYLEAGSQCVITTSYQASISGLVKTGLNESQAKDLILNSVTLAEQAIKEYMVSNSSTERPFVAASIGPYGASLADGSEYHGDYGVADAVLIDHHKKQIDLLATTNAEIFACETIPSLQEARVLKQLLAEQEKPAWISFSCKDGRHLSDGTQIEDCVREFNQCSNPVALGVNCTNPKYMVELIERIKVTCPEKFIVVYPNSGEDFDATNKTWHGTASPNECGSASTKWQKAGANIVGGCCRMGPEHIVSIKQALK